MSTASITRLNRDFDITLHTATALATTLDIRDMAGAVVSFGTMSTSASNLQMWVAPRADASFARLYKTDGSAADLKLTPPTTEGRAYALPDEVYGAEFLKIVSSSTHSTGVTGVVMMKT